MFTSSESKIYAKNHYLCKIDYITHTMTAKKPIIFISNDDGYQALGFRRIVECAAKYGRVIAVAPEVTQSGKAHAITMYEPLHLDLRRDEENISVYSCSGTPVDCVKIAYDWLLPELGIKPDLNISGINHGSNAAINVLYSGTMGAAIEASFYGAPSVGLSLDDHRADADFDATIEFADKLIPALLGAKVETPLCLNINVPIARPEEIQGHRICRQTRGFWREEFFCRQDPRGRNYFWLTGGFCNHEPEAEDSDEWALKNKYIAVVPIKVDLTDHSRIPELKELL